MSTPVKPDNAASPGDKACPQPTLAEAYFFLNIIKFNKSKLDTEWDKVAEASGFKNAETAKVRFGQIKKKLGFQTATPMAARVRPGKRGADNDEPGASAEKKPRKTPAKPRAKKQPAGSSAPDSSPVAPGDDSPLAAKSSKKSKVSAATTSKLKDDKMETDQDLETLIKPEQFDSDSDEEEVKNAQAKAELFKQISQEQIRTEREDHPDPSKQLTYDNRGFTSSNHFAQANMLASFDAQQVQAPGIAAQQARTPLPTSARQVRNAAAQQAIADASNGHQAHATTASTANLRQQEQNGGGYVTTVQAGQQDRTAAQPTTEGHHVTQDHEMDNLPPADADDGIAAFNAVMYGAGGNAGLFHWDGF